MLLFLLNLSWLMVLVGCCYVAYTAGRRKEHGLWLRWYEAEEAIKEAEAAQRKADQDKRSFTLNTVQFRRD